MAPPRSVASFQSLAATRISKPTAVLAQPSATKFTRLTTPFQNQRLSDSRAAYSQASRTSYLPRDQFNVPSSCIAATSISTCQTASPASHPTKSQAIDQGAPLRYNGTYATTFPHARRAFSTTRQNQKSHHFDTLKFVQRLKAEGFNEEQAVAMMRVLNSVIEESIQNLTRTMVLKEEAERSTYTQKVDFAKLRSELANADSSEIQLTRTSHERLSSDLAKLSARLRDEIGRTQASVRLDMNLERGRIREEANSQDQKIKETEARIEQEVASLRERVEAVKFSTLQWLMGVCTGTAALILGAWRLLM